MKIFGTLGAEDRHGLDRASVQVQAYYAKDGSVYPIRFKKKTIQTSYTDLKIKLFKLVTRSSGYSLLCSVLQPGLQCHNVKRHFHSEPSSREFNSD
jgi:hypothetical protein